MLSRIKGLLVVIFWSEHNAFSTLMSVSTSVYDYNAAVVF